MSNEMMAMLKSNANNPVQFGMFNKSSFESTNNSTPEGDANLYCNE